MPDYTEKNWDTGDTFRASDATEMSRELQEQEAYDATQDATRTSDLAAQDARDDTQEATRTSDLATQSTRDSGQDTAISGKQASDSDLTTIAAINTDGYAKRTSGVWAPVSGIPKADLATAVQTSLNKADWGTGSLQPEDYGFQSWVCDPEMMFQGSGTNGYLWMMAIRAKLSTITSLVLNLYTAGGTLTSGRNWAGLYSATGTLLGSTADQTTNWSGAVGLQKMPIVGGPVTVTPGDVYYLGWVSYGTTPAAMTQVIGGAFGSGTVYPPSMPYRFIYDNTHGAANTTLPNPAGPAFALGTHYWGAFI